MSDVNLVGQTLHHFRILEELGHGGMGAVYKAHQLDLERRVALKVLKPALNADQSYVARFQQEARSAARLDHRNIVPIYEVGSVGAIQFISMKYIEGQTLAELVKSIGPLPLGQAIQLLEQVAEALDYAHERGIIHRDIKPSNVMVTPEGWVYLTDFGLARAAEAQSLTQKGMVIGTPNYMAPEQASGQPASPATDIYAFALVAYELLTSRLPFSGSTSGEILVARITGAPRPPSDFRLDLSTRVEEVIMRSLARTPQARYGSAREMVAELKAAAQQPVAATVRPNPREAPTVAPQSVPYAQPQGWQGGGGPQAGGPYSPGPQTPYPTPHTPYPGQHHTPHTPYPTPHTPYPTPHTPYPTPHTPYPTLGGQARSRLPLMLALSGLVVLLIAGAGYLLLRGTAGTTVVDRPEATPEATPNDRADAQVQAELDQALAAFERRGGMDEAIAQASAALKHDPNSVKAHTLLAMFYNMRSKDEESVAAADKALAIDPRHALAHVWRSSALGGLNRDSESLQAAEQAIKLEPELSHAYMVRALARTNLAIRDSDQSLIEQAFEDSAKAESLTTSGDTFALAMAHSTRGYVHYGRYVLTQDATIVKDARDSFIKAIALQDQIAWLHSNLGYFESYLGEENYDDAREAFERAIERDPQYGHAYAGLGWLHYYANDYEAAIEQFTLSIERNQRDADAYNGRALCYFQLAKPEEGSTSEEIEQAIRDQEQVVKLHPNREDYWLTLGNIYKRAGDTKKANEAYEQSLQLYQQALARDPKSAVNHSGMGWVYYAMLEYTKAIGSFDRAIEINPRLADAYQGKARALTWLDEFEDACATIQEGLKQVPGNGILTAELEQQECE